MQSSLRSGGLLWRVRGPAVGADRAIDLSKAAAAELGMLEEGTAPVRIEAKDAEPGRGPPGSVPD